jgi:hypothetical protein
MMSPPNSKLNGEPYQGSIVSGLTFTPLRQILRQDANFFSA